MLSSLIKKEISKEEYIRENNITIWEEELPNYVLGFIWKCEKDILITINSYLSEEEKEYTILHEFAHYELNKDKIVLLDYKFKDERDKADEYIDILLNK